MTETEQPGVWATLPDETSFRCIIYYCGAYAYWDLPNDAVGDVNRDLEAVEGCVDSESDTSY